MGLFQFIKSLFASGTYTTTELPQRQAQAPSTIDHRDLATSHVAEAASSVDVQSSTQPATAVVPSSMQDFDGLSADVFQPLSQDEALDASIDPNWRNRILGSVKRYSIS